MYQSQQNKYLEASIRTASPAQLLVMLCDGAIRFGRLAMDSFDKSNPSDAVVYVDKVKDIVMEFMITLDRKSPLSDDLLKLYEYFLHKLEEGKRLSDRDSIAEIVGYIADLKKTWVEAAQLANASKASPVNG